MTERIVYVERARRPVNGMAVTSFVMSVLWLGGIGSFAGIIFGMVGVHECREHDMSGVSLAHTAWVLGTFGLSLSAILWYIILF